ncbi:MAG: hypothetical protein AB7H77_09585 [Bdellovibrionales bacterium]
MTIKKQKALSPHHAALLAASAKKGGAWQHNFKRKPEELRTGRDGIVHHSVANLKYWEHLKTMQRAGLIRGLKREIVYPIINAATGTAFKSGNGQDMRYTTDFEYIAPAPGVKLAPAEVKRRAAAEEPMHDDEFDMVIEVKGFTKEKRANKSIQQFEQQTGRIVTVIPYRYGKFLPPMKRRTFIKKKEGK